MKRASKTISNTILGRVYLVFGFFVLMAVAIVIRIVAIQFNSEYWAKKDSEEHVFFKEMVADRGSILAEDGSLLASSLPFYKIAFDPSIIDTATYLNYRDSLWQLSCNLATYFDTQNKDTLAYFNRLDRAKRTGKKYAFLTRKYLSASDLDVVEKWPLLNLGHLKGGFIVQKVDNRRHYPYGKLASITLGRMAGDTLGIRGIEAAYNKDLRGNNGYILAQKIRGGHFMPLQQYGEKASDDGMDVITTLDINMQDIVDQALRRGVERHNAKYGAAVLIEVKTGKIKALANYPEDYNYAVAGQIEPGSTFKLISAAAALEDKMIDICDTIDTGNGKIKFDDKEITDVGAYGKLSFEQVFYKSSNVGMAKLISEGYDYKEGDERFLWRVKKFGFSDVVNKQLLGEPKPVIHQPGDKSADGKLLWTSASRPSMAIGYSVLVTPLQMATAYNAIANEGQAMRPWIVKELRDGAKTVRQYGPEKLGEPACSPETAQKLKEMMMKVVDKGTARSIRGTRFSIAGKTGTARKFVDGKYRKKYIASFGGFFPAEEPRYTLYIVVDEPRNGAIYGGAIAAPIFKEIATNVYKFDHHLAKPRIKKTEKAIKKPTSRGVFADNAKQVYEEFEIATSLIPEAEYVTASSDGHQINYNKKKLLKGKIPNMRGMSARDAVSLLEKLGVAVHLKGHGKVKRQSLRLGTRIGKNTHITLVLG